MMFLRIFLSTQRFKVIAVSFAFAQCFYLTDGKRCKSANFKRHAQIMIKGAEIIATTKVEDALECMFFCLREFRCLSANLEKKPNGAGARFCHIYGTLLGTNGAILVPSDQYDFYDSMTVPVSCSHAKSLGYHDSKFYVIDPDGPHGDVLPFHVYCNMSSHNGIGVTVVSHNSEYRTRVSGCEANGCYRRDVVYDGISDVNQLRALTAISSGCEQFVKYECFNSPFWIHSDSPVGWPVSRDDRPMKYWGGALRDSGKCGCSVTNSCVKGKDCNCDANDENWREDSGLFTYKEDLPIVSLRFGDVSSNDNEEGYHTLGKLECFGWAA